MTGKINLDIRCRKLLISNLAQNDTFFDFINCIYYRDVVQLWTNHRVMEWLKEVDLAEYAPNLRGSGVHGALILYEPRFDDVLLADLLSIPSSKTLLRRHLSIHFKEVVGRDIMQRKRTMEKQESVARKAFRQQKRQQREKKRERKREKRTVIRKKLDFNNKKTY